MLVSVWWRQKGEQDLFRAGLAPPIWGSQLSYLLLVPDETLQAVNGISRETITRKGRERDRAFWSLSFKNQPKAIKKSKS